MKIPVKTMEDQEKIIEESQDEQEQTFHETGDAADADVTGERSVRENGQRSAEEIEPGDDIVELSDEPEAEEAPEEDDVTRLKRLVAEKEQEAKEQYEARLRLQAELDNFKKRKEREVLEFRKYANEDFIRELLVVVDDFERAIAAAEQTHKLEDFLAGVEMIFEKFLGTLKKRGVKEIEAQGQPFNPEIHEAVTQIETDDMEEGTVAAVFQKGYYLHDRVIVAPKVGVAK